MKNFKKIITLFLAVCMILSVFTLTSCNKNKDDVKNDTNGTDNTGSTGKNYTVTVLDNDNAPISGVKLVITDGKDFITATTDANGKASAELTEGTVSVMITSTPDGYEKPDKVSGTQYHGVFTSGSTELTVKLTKKSTGKVTYTITVLDTEGNPVVGMQVQLCPDGVCLADKFYTNEFGEVTAEIVPGKEVDVKLLPLDGYILPEPTKGDYHASIPADETEIEINTVINN